MQPQVLLVLISKYCFISLPSPATEKAQWTTTPHVSVCTHIYFNKDNLKLLLLLCNFSQHLTRTIKIILPANCRHLQRQATTATLPKQLVFSDIWKHSTAAFHVLLPHPCYELPFGCTPRCLLPLVEPILDRAVVLQQALGCWGTRCSCIQTGTHSFAQKL